MANINGGPGNDTLTGTHPFLFLTDGENLIHGNDLICGLRGDDRLYGDDGDDRVYGGDGNDWVSGGEVMTAFTVAMTMSTGGMAMTAYTVA